MILSAHLADVGRAQALRLLRGRLEPGLVSGLHYAEITTAAPLSGHLLPKPETGRIGLIAAWRDDDSLDRFLAGHELAEQLAGGWRVRLQPTRMVGSWAPLQGLVPVEVPMDAEEPAAVITLGRLRISQVIRFLRASAGAEGLAVEDPALLASSALARAPRLVATFSVWSSTSAMRAYVEGVSGPGHRAALGAHAARPFHVESAFLRFRPYACEGERAATELSAVPAAI